MIRIPGWAFEKNGEEEGKKRSERYEEIKHHKKEMGLKPVVRYARTEYSGKVPDRSLSDLDLLLLCDSGNTCFGGTVTRTNNGEAFTATVYTD